jgi:SAM-dependent methyltransferase
MPDTDRDASPTTFDSSHVDVSAGRNSATDRSPCYVCGHGAFAHTPVLWPELIAAWELSRDEAELIDIQQGTHCVSCGSNVRSIALARAILRQQAYAGYLVNFVAEKNAGSLRVLEINEAGGAHRFLRTLPRHVLASYPDIDMLNLRFPSGVFDLVVHSDTLEHVSDPLLGLQECRRVLKDRGALVFTVPVVLGRLSRSRHSLPGSFHGHSGCRDADMMVHTEFGVDIWTLLIRAGFDSCEMHPYRFPAGLAISAHKIDERGLKREV